mgnify:FL=1
MPATRDGKTWRSQFYYEDWQGVRHKKNKRGFETKAEAEEWERNFRQQQRKDLDINFGNKYFFLRSRYLFKNGVAIML